MKIVAAFATPQEVEPLIAAGADELYCGVVPEAFAGAPSQGRLNRRPEPEANIRDLAELTDIVTRAAASDVPVAVTLDEHAYSPPLIPSLVELAGDLVEAGARALIVTDIALVLAIRQAGLPLDLHLSGLAMCRNSEAAAFFADLGIQRVVLPRYLSTQEIARLCGGDVPVDYQVLVMNDGCGLEEGQCPSLHQPWGPMCQTEWRAEHSADAPVSPGFAAQWEENWRAYRYLMGLLVDPGGAVSRRGFPTGPCGVCALPALQAAAVGYVEVSGRERSPDLRVGGVRLVRAVLNWVERGDLPELIADNARALKDTPLLCDSTYTCYFREGLAPDDAGAARARSLALAHLAAAAHFQRAPQDAIPAAGRAHSAAPVPSPPAVSTEWDHDDPDVARLRRIAEALSGTGIDLRWSGARLELTFPDEAQPEGISCVTLAKVDETERCYARSGNLGIWHAGHLMTPRLAQAIKGMVRLLELIPA
ncbi:MAG: U32 family peptidase [Deltaproteobacteria bacterium]|nr:U32 family peptidase [Deltaproteobacteria bacterium]